MTPAAVAAFAFEIALLVCGLWLIWRFVLSRRARASRVARLPEWGLPPLDFACFLCFGFVGAIALSGVAGLIVRHASLSTDAATLAGSAVAEGGLLLGLAAFYLVFGARAGGAVGRASPLAALRSGVVTFLIAMPIVVAVGDAWGVFLTRMGLPAEKQELMNILENTQSGGLRWVFVAVATLLVPAAEEFLFRAGLFRYFRTRAPRWVAIGLTSALFGALHVAWGDHMIGLPSFLPLTALAVVFCLAYERTGMIGTTIVAHALFNLNTIFQVFMGVT